MRHANGTPPSRPAARFSDGAFLGAAVAAIALTGLVAHGARSWIDHPFAGFFLRADRTVAAVGRTAWSDVTASRLYERTVVAVDGVAIDDADALQRRVAAKPIGSPTVYTLTDGTTTDTVTLSSRRFSSADYWAVFGAYLGTGLCYVLLAILAAWALPAERVGRALLLLGGVGGVFMVTSADLYPPASSLRLHALAAAFLPAVLLQFALAVGDTRRRFATSVLPVVWAISIAAAASMQLAIGHPTESRFMHVTSDATVGLALVAATIGLTTRVRIATETAPLVACTALFGLGVPAVVFLLAGTLGGVPQNASATLAFLFPLGMSAALLRGDTALLRGNGTLLRSNATVRRSEACVARDVARASRSL
jgi:hypothetical protein